MAYAGDTGSHGIVADLGGGSLELARVRNGVTEKWATLPLGVLALREYSKNNRAEMSKIIEAALGNVRWLKSGKRDRFTLLAVHGVTLPKCI